MARIRRFSRIAHERSRYHPSEVDCTYDVLDTPYGRVVQLDTLGSG